MPEFKDYLHLHFLVLIWGFTAILGLLITIPPVEVVFYRTLFATMGLGLILYLKKMSYVKTKDDMIKLFLTGSLIAGHWILFFTSARVSTTSVCLTGMAKQLVPSPLVNRVKICMK